MRAGLTPDIKFLNNIYTESFKFRALLSFFNYRLHFSVADVYRSRLTLSAFDVRTNVNAYKTRE